jgi:2-phospho-L-lactate guanylyltransferase
MSCWALVPVKARAACKRRLSAVLDEAARAALVQGMLEHVLGQLRRCASLDGIAVMSADPNGLPADVLWLGDAGTELNESLRGALSVLSARGAQRAVVVAADLPWLSAAEVGVLIAASEACGVALAPDRHDSGTNALALALPSRFCTHFGPASLALHQAEATRLGLTPAIVRLSGLEFDVDVPEDLARLELGHNPR